MVSRWARVLVALAGTNKGYEWVVGQWWETIAMICSSGKENLNLLLRLTQVEANIDLKDLRRRFLKGVFKSSRVSGASATTPGNNWLHRESKVKSTKERLLRSKAMT